MFGRLRKHGLAYGPRELVQQNLWVYFLKIQDANLQIVAESVLNLVFDPRGAKFVFVTHVVDSQKAVVGEHHVEVSLLRYPG